MRLAVTGASGFIGARMAERGRSRGWDVRGLDLDPRHEGVSRGDVTQADDTRRLCEGADVVVHTAAVVREDGDPAVFERVNVGGTARLADAARAAGVSQLVHLSSVMVYGFDFPDPVTEEGPYPTLETNPYVVTKLRSEGAARRAHPDVRVTLIRPGDVYGPGSIPWVERPLALMREGLFALPDGGRGILNHLHVENLVDAVFAAVDREVGGVPINVTDGARTTCAEYFGALARTFDLPPPRTFPGWALRGAFSALEAGFDLVGAEPPARPAALAYLLRPGVYSIDRAREVLGYSPRVSLDEGMAALRG